MPFKSIQRRHGRTNTRTWHWKKIISAGRFRERDPRAFATMTSQYGRIYPRCSERNWWQPHDDGIIAIILDHLPSIIGRPRRRNAREGRVSEKRFHVWPKKMISPNATSLTEMPIRKNATERIQPLTAVPIRKILTETWHWLIANT